MKRRKNKVYYREENKEMLRNDDFAKMVCIAALMILYMVIIGYLGSMYM